MKVAVPATVGVLMAVVAIASRTTATGAAPRVDTGGAAWSVAFVFAFAGAGLILVGLGMAALAARDNNLRPPPRVWRRLARTGGVAVAVLALLVFGRVVIGGLDRPPTQVPEELPERFTIEAEPANPLTQPGGRLTLVVVVAAAIATSAAVIVLRRRARDPDDRAPELAEALQRGIDDLRSATDARAAVVSAYARLEAVLRASARGRLPQETTVEYVERILIDSRVPEDAVVVLGRLYQRARYAEEPVDRSMQLQAIDALVAVGDAVRAQVSRGADAYDEPSVR